MGAEQLITKHLDVWTGAIKPRAAVGRGSSNKIELYGIKRLRELILDLAVRGLLVPQDSNDEHASLLVKKISAEKQRLVKENKIKKEKAIPQVEAGEKTFNLPEGWEWVRLAEISAFVHYGYTASADENIENVRLLRITDIQNDRVNWSTVPGCEIDKDKVAQYQLENEDILIARTGGTIGKSYLVENINVCAVFASYLIRVKHIVGTNASFKKVFLGSPFYWNQLYASSMGTGQPNVNGEALKKLVVPLPPLKEQERIVSKVKDLMSLCDQLEQQTEASLSAHQTLVETLLSALTNAADHDTFQQAWQRIAQHFDTLFTTEHGIDQLKQTILQLAVMGKLVPQNPNDEPASELLKNIVAEKEKLIKEGKIKKQKPLPPITDEEKPFELPNGWEWARLGDTGIGSTGKTPSTKEPKFFEGEIPFIGPGQITPNGKLLKSEKFISEAGIKNSEEAISGDVLMVCIGGSIGKAVISNQRLAFNQQINAIRPIFLLTKFLFIAVSTDNFQKSVLDTATGSATPIINRSKWEELLVPVCSEKEQIRIIEKVDELTSICEQLKTQVSQAKTVQLLLADAIISSALN
ncbi:restriction endonuclease subunit S [Aurantivibrio infirmus]